MIDLDKILADNAKIRERATVIMRKFKAGRWPSERYDLPIASIDQDIPALCDTIDILVAEIRI